MAFKTIRELIPLSNTAVSDVPISAIKAQYLAGSSAGTVFPDTCVVVDNNKKINEIDITSLKLNGAALTSTAAELNYLDGVTPGNNLANKAPILDASKDLELGTGDVNCTNISCSLVDTTNTSITNLKLKAGATITDIDTVMQTSPTDTQLLTAQGIKEYIDEQVKHAIAADTSKWKIRKYTMAAAGSVGYNRVMGIAYQNTTGYPMFVVVSFSVGEGGKSYLQVSRKIDDADYVNVGAIGSQQENGKLYYTGGTGAIIVPPNHYYKCTGTDPNGSMTASCTEVYHS